MCRAYNFKYNTMQLRIHIYRLSSLYTLDLDFSRKRYYSIPSRQKRIYDRGELYRFYNLMAVNI
jgi:hypothetical protein